MQRMKSPQAWVAVALVLMLLGGALAYLVNTSFGSVTVTKVEFNTERGRLSGLLYVPRDASAENPRPTIVTTTGYLNAREMQAAPAVEMSRRGMVVLALDHYSHGSSFLNEIAPGNEFMSFWPNTLYDGVQYIYNQPYVLKDAEGNGVIAVSGHSMGGFASTMAVAFDEQDFQAATAAGEPAVRKVMAGLSVGADFSISGWLGITPAVADSLYGTRTMGMIAAQFDEFFFGAEDDAGSVVRKNFIGTPAGQTFLGNPSSSEVGEFVSTATGGQRVIYQPFETHPWSHFSIRSTRSMIDFYTTAFADYSDTMVERGGQIWFLKEWISVLGLIGFYLLLIPLVMLIGRLPFLKNAVTEPIPEITGPTTGGSKAIYWISIALAAGIPALIYATYLDRNAANLNVMRIIGLILFFASVVMAAINFFRNRGNEAVPYLFAGVGAFILAGLAAGSGNILQLTPIYNSPVTNNVAFWATSVAAVTLIIVALVYATAGQKSGLSARIYGFMVPARSIVASFVVAVIVAASAFLMVQLVHALFSVDFRLWLIAVRAFNGPSLVTSLVYMPFVFTYFLLNGAALQAGTRTQYVNGRRGYWIALITNIGGLAIWLLLQYGLLFITGKAAFVSQSLNGIVLIGLAVNLGIATIITKKALEKTNNIYTGAFLNTMVITVITISTSTLYWSLG